MFAMKNLGLEKINELLLKHYNVFHADLVTRAIQDDDMSIEVFERGCREIQKAELVENDEFVPKGWEEV